jgi:hypothetical protein
MERSYHCPEIMDGCDPPIADAKRNEHPPFIFLPW